METKIFDAPIAEYKTRKAAEKFMKRIIGGGYIKISKKSAFDMFHLKGKILYQVFPNRNPQNYTLG